MVKINFVIGDEIFAEAGAMGNMTGSFKVESLLKGDVITGIKRAVVGKSLFLTRFVFADEPDFVSFAGTMPGKIFMVPISEWNEFIPKRESFLDCEKSVDLEIALDNKIRTSLFGGPGFILQRMSGKGIFFLHCRGDIIDMTLRHDEVVEVKTGLIVGFGKTVGYDTALAVGITSALFGGRRAVCHDINRLGKSRSLIYEHYKDCSISNPVPTQAQDKRNACIIVPGVCI
ncbi:MAG: AIM24 family protein [Methanomicrobiales archaeon]